MGRLPPKEGICRKTAKTAVLMSSHSHWHTGLRSKACCQTDLVTVRVGLELGLGLG